MQGTEPLYLKFGFEFGSANAPESENSVKKKSADGIGDHGGAEWLSLPVTT
jgi:hypothetical protein